MKINITKEQYKNLVMMSGIANSVVGVLGDMRPDKDYKQLSNKLDELEKYFLQYAQDFDLSEFVQDYDGENVFDDEVYENVIMPILEDYDEHVFYELLANKLAWRDFYRDHSEEEIEKLSEEHGGYFGVPLHKYEERYWDELEKHGLERLSIDEKAN